MSTSSGRNRKNIAVTYEDESKSNEAKNYEKKTKVEPKNWKILFDNIKIMRSTQQAPVDTLGCDNCKNPNDSLETQRYQILVALILSAQTKDQVTYEACQRLHTFGFTVENIAKTDQSQLEEVIKPVGFYKTKSKHIIQTSQILMEKYNSCVPNDIKSLLTLPGVGKKIANIALASCYNNITGIGVDIHVHRIANRLNLVSSTKKPEQTELELESWLPFDKWKEINSLFVGFGQTICNASNPRCNECLNKEICPYALNEKNAKKK